MVSVNRLCHIEMQKARAELLPPSLNMYGLQPQQLLFLRVKFLLRNNAHVQQFLKLFQVIGGGVLLNNLCDPTVCTCFVLCSYILHHGNGLQNLILLEISESHMFCDARQLIYEWEPWDNSAGLTDKTQELYELIKANFSLKRPTDFDEWENADDGSIELEGLSEEMLKQKMNEKQKAVFEDLKTISCDCSREMWFRTGICLPRATKRQATP